jgi:GAF domain-containing protein
LLRVIEGWAIRSVPECVALSVTLLDEDLTFTLVDESSAGPSVTEPLATRSGVPPRVDAGHALDEHDWADMARGRAFDGIASTVSLPVVDHGRAVLIIDLYASTAHAFHDRIDDLVEALGAWQAGAVTNADLGFDTLRRAEAAPARLRDQRVIDVAVGLVAARMGVSTEEALGRLRRAAESSGVSEVQVAAVARSLLA